MQEKTIIIHEVIKDYFAVSTEDAQRVFDWLEKAWNEFTKITLSFKDIKILSPAFLNIAVGQLYGKYPGNEISDKINFIDIEKDNLDLIKQVQDNAIKYFKDKKIMTS